MPSLRVGLVGLGVVGGGVVLLCNSLHQKKAALLRPSLDLQIEIATICVLNLDKARDVDIPTGAKLTSDINEILNDPAINCVVEVMGGTTIAKDVVFGAIRAGKHVVTANKALLAAYIVEIQQLLREHPTASLRFEAAVCGGIPIINSLQSDYLCDNISSIMGIMNGTTNYMLSKMEDEKMAYDDVLREAQRLGFAELDPTADVEGLDVRNKICILSKLCFGVDAADLSRDIPTVGIFQIKPCDFSFARSRDATIKLIGSASINSTREESSSLSIYVSPSIVPRSNIVATIKGPGNIVLVGSENLGTTSYIGPGAGRLATANSVLSDMIRLAQGVGSGDDLCSRGASQPFPFPIERAPNVVIEPDYSARFYVRFNASRASLAAISEARARAFSLSEMFFFTNLNPSENDFLSYSDPTDLSVSSGTKLVGVVITTGAVLSRSAMFRFIEILGDLGICSPLIMPFVA